MSRPIERHGMSRSREYRARAYMLTRCYNANADSYPNYGGRGITVCARWRDSFAAFFADLGSCPEGFELDRIDVNGNYEPGNVRWVDHLTQRRNRRGVYRIESAAGGTDFAGPIATQNGILRQTFSGRMRAGWSVTDAVSVPPRTTVPRVAVYVGQVRMAEAMAARGHSLGVVASLLPADAASVSRLLSGQRRAGLRLACKIERLYPDVRIAMWREAVPAGTVLPEIPIGGC